MVVLSEGTHIWECFVTLRTMMLVGCMRVAVCMFRAGCVEAFFTDRAS